MPPTKIDTIPKQTSGPTTVLAVTLALICISACGATDEQSAEPADLATVNGASISGELFAVWVQDTLQKKIETLTPQERTKALDALINVFVAADEASKLGLGRVVNEHRLELDRQTMLADALLKHKLATIEPTDQELRTEYDRQVAAMPTLEYKARHVLVGKEAEAREAITRLQKGAVFDDVVRTLSLDSSKEKGGEIGWFSLPQVPPQIAQAVEQLKKGEVTADPVESQFGWHVIIVDDIRAVSPPPFDDVKDRILPLLQERALHEYVDGLRAKSQVQTQLDDN